MFGPSPFLTSVFPSVKWAHVGFLIASRVPGVSLYPHIFHSSCANTCSGCPQYSRSSCLLLPLPAPVPLCTQYPLLCCAPAPFGLNTILALPQHYSCPAWDSPSSIRLTPSACSWIASPGSLNPPSQHSPQCPVSAVSTAGLGPSLLWLSALDPSRAQ